MAAALNTLVYAPELCIGCGACVDVCPHAVFGLNGSRVRLVSPERCMECGACQRNCPVGAIAVDSGVGCATAMIRAALLRRKEPTCGNSGEA
jgi:ferredoxin